MQMIGLRTDYMPTWANSSGSYVIGPLRECGPEYFPKVSKHSNKTIIIQKSPNLASLRNVKLFFSYFIAI